MKANVTMKALSVAVLGLAGFAFAGSSMAACPAGPTVAEGGAWSAKAETDGTFVVATGGAVSTECTGVSTLAATAGSLASATVRDDTPTNEARYRLQFYINADALTGFTGLQGAQVLQVQSAAAGASSSRQMLRATILPGGASGKQIRFFLANNVGPSFRTLGAPIDLAAGWNRVQIDLVTGATGTAKIWVNNGTEASPTQTIPTTGSVDNSSWVGVDRTFMGLSAPTSEYVTTQATRGVRFDEFDSRRQTFIN
jgi:hypothetical protein